LALAAGVFLFRASSALSRYDLGLFFPDAVCGFDFKKVYGELGDGFIEAHHLLPISQKSAGTFSED